MEGDLTLSLDELTRITARMEAMDQKMSAAITSLQTSLITAIGDMRAELRVVGEATKMAHKRNDKLEKLLEQGDGGLQGQLAVSRAEQGRLREQILELAGRVKADEDNLDGRISEVNKRQDKLLVGLISTIVGGLITVAVTAIKVLGGIPVQ